MAKPECCWKCPDNWSEWSKWLAAGLHARNRWRLPVLLVGILFASGRRTVTTWLRAAGVSDDSPTKRYGPKVEGADVHHNPTPGPADQPFLYGHIWVTISLALRHPQWGAIGLPLRAMLYVRKRTMAAIPSGPSCVAF